MCLIPRTPLARTLHERIPYRNNSFGLQVFDVFSLRYERQYPTLVFLRTLMPFSGFPWVFGKSHIIYKTKRLLRFSILSACLTISSVPLIARANIKTNIVFDLNRSIVVFASKILIKNEKNVVLADNYD